MAQSTSVNAQLQTFDSVRLGKIAYDPDKTLHFPEGMVGFSVYKEYLLIPHDTKGSPFSGSNAWRTQRLCFR